VTDITAGYSKQLPKMKCGIDGNEWDRIYPPPCTHTQAELDAYEQANPGQSRWVVLPDPGP
jgi:hypothetical protein